MFGILFVCIYSVIMLFFDDGVDDSSWNVVGCVCLLNRCLLVLSRIGMMIRISLFIRLVVSNCCISLLLFWVSKFGLLFCLSVCMVVIMLVLRLWLWF